MSRFLRPLGIATAIGLPLYATFSSSRHRSGIEKQGRRALHHLPPPPRSPAADKDDAEEAPAAFNASHYPKGLNAGFISRTKEQVVEFYGPRFENGEARDIAAHQDKILDALGAMGGHVVLDVGSGTGFFLKALSERVGARGLVVATDLAEGMCDRLRERIQEESIGNAIVFQSTEKALAIPRAVEADLVFVCDVYHHLTFPKTFLKDIKAHLRDDGKLVVVDFHRDPSRMHPPHDGNWVLDHVRADKDVFQQEIERAGFQLVDEPPAEATGLTENYMLVFKKQAAVA